MADDRTPASAADAPAASVPPAAPVAQPVAPAGHRLGPPPEADVNAAAEQILREMNRRLQSFGAELQNWVRRKGEQASAGLSTLQEKVQEGATYFQSAVHEQADLFVARAEELAEAERNLAATRAGTPLPDEDEDEFASREPPETPAEQEQRLDAEQQENAAQFSEAVERIEQMARRTEHLLNRQGAQFSGALRTIAIKPRRRGSWPDGELGDIGGAIEDDPTIATPSTIYAK